MLESDAGLPIRSAPALGHSAQAPGHSAPALGHSAPALGRSAPALAQSALARPHVSVLIPAYNSERTLPVVVDGVRRVLHEGGLRCEFVLVDDSSSDQTWRVIREIAAQASDVRGFHLRRNFGQHNALLAAIRAARGDLILTLDDDLQHPPGEIPKLFRELEKGYDVVYGFPIHLPHSATRNVLSLMTKIALQKAMGADTARHHSAFRLFKTSLREAFDHYHDPHVSIDVLLSWATKSFSWVPVEHRQRETGKSNYTLLKLLTHAMTLVTGFSTLPLRLASVLGLFFTGVGILVLVFVLVRYFVQGGAVPGFPFIACTIAIFSGAQLFALGIIGEYLARVHMRSLGRPAFVIAETTERPAVDAEISPCVYRSTSSV